MLRWPTVGVLATVGHAQETLAGVLELEVLIGELGAVDGLATGAIALCEITARKSVGHLKVYAC